MIQDESKDRCKKCVTDWDTKNCDCECHSPSKEQNSWGEEKLKQISDEFKEQCFENCWRIDRITAYWLEIICEATSKSYQEGYGEGFKTGRIPCPECFQAGRDEEIKRCLEEFRNWWTSPDCDDGEVFEKRINELPHAK